MLSKVFHCYSRFVRKTPLLVGGAASSLGIVLLSSKKHENKQCESTTWQSAGVALCESPTAPEGESEEDRFKRTLSHHRANIAEYRSRWEYKMPGTDSSSTSTLTATVTPSRSWPDDVPSDDMLSMLLNDTKYCDRSPNFRSDKEYCNKLRFRVACALIVQFDETQQKLGLEMLKTLAEHGYRDAMTYYGMCLNDGRAGLEPNPIKAVSFFRQSVDMYGHSQAQYELGVAHYTGEGVVEDGEKAVWWFLQAAVQDHPAACYMLGDCLLDGEGVQMDRGAALEWLIRSAELGHRGARSRVMAVLEKKDGEDYGRFTDASRQTLVEHTYLSANERGDIIQRRTTVAKPNTRAVINPTELKRRQTIVQHSRAKS